MVLWVLWVLQDLSGGEVNPVQGAPWFSPLYSIQGSTEKPPGHYPHQQQLTLLVEVP